jgi:hypothetical protein
MLPTSASSESQKDATSKMSECIIRRVAHILLGTENEII